MSGPTKEQIEDGRKEAGEELEAWLSPIYRAYRVAGFTLALLDAYEERGREIERLTGALNARNTLTCVCCGAAYPPVSPTHGSSVLTAHIKVCPKHPLRQAEANLAQVVEAASLLLSVYRNARLYKGYKSPGPLDEPAAGMVERRLIDALAAAQGDASPEPEVKS